VAKKIAAETPNAYYIGQFQNLSNPRSHHDTTGPELWDQTGGTISAFVGSAGTGGTIAGVGQYLKERRSDVAIVLGDPEGSLYAHYVRTRDQKCQTGPYKVEGIGNDYLPASSDFSVVDHAYTVSDRESFNAARRLARTEGLFCGGSTGTNLVAAQKYIDEVKPGRDAVVVVFLCDTGERYLSKMFNDDWMRENQFLGDRTARTAAELLFNKEANAPALVAAGPETPIEQVFNQIKALDISQVPVMENGVIVGAVTETQLLDLLLKGADFSRTVVRDVMGDPLRTVESTATAHEMLRVMQDSGQGAVLVRQGAGFDILTKFDLLRAL
jgi:cystathionine beta-synthase